MVANSIVVRVWPLLAICGSSVCCALTPNRMANLVSSLQSQLHFSCVYLTHSIHESERLQESAIIVEMQKKMGRHRQTGVFPSILHKPFVHSCRGLPLLIVTNIELLVRKSDIKEVLETRQSELMWLLLLRRNQTAAALQDVHIRFDALFFIAEPTAESAVLISEAYRVGEGYPLVTQSFCTWNPASQLSCRTEGIRMRRNDLMGYRMKSGVVEGDIGVETVNAAHCTGFTCDLWEILSRRLNFTYQYEEVVGWGIRSRGGSWSGLMGRLLAGSLDVGVGFTTITSQRQRVVDFSLPLVFSGYKLYIQTPREQVFTWSHFLRPFDVWLWLCSVTLVVTTWAVLRLQSRFAQGAQSEINGSGTYDFLQVLGIFLMQGVGGGQEVTPRDCVRAALAAASLCALLLYTAYCGVLTASLASGRPRLPFQDLSGLLRDASYTLVTVADSSIIDVLRDSNNPVDREVYEKHIEGKYMPYTSEDLFGRLCSTQKYAVIVSKTRYRHSTAYVQCPVISVHESGRSQEGFVFTKKSPYREAINYHLLRLRSEGLLDHLLCSRDPQQHQQQPPPVVAVRQVAPALAVLAAAAVAAVCLLLLENVCCRRNATTVQSIDRCSTSHTPFMAATALIGVTDVLY